MDWSTVIVGISTALLGGGIGSYLSYRVNFRSQKANEFQMVLQERKEITSKLEERLNKMEEEIIILRHRENEAKEEIQSLRNQLLIFESSHADIPLPMWMKDTAGKMIFLNAYYEDAFLKPRGYDIRDYIGKDDYAVWSEEIAKQFIVNDKEVMRTKKYVKKIEKLEDMEGEYYYAKILKYPRKLGANVIGISGIILETSKNKEDL